MSSSEARKILHVDLDAFYASVEQRDNPGYQGKPLVVGGLPKQRGVVVAASYEARKFGIHSAMPSYLALQKCPTLVFAPPRFEVYRSISTQIHAIFKHHTDLVEPIALDEAYLDVTQNKLGLPYATTIAKQIKAAILAETNGCGKCRSFGKQVPGKNSIGHEQAQRTNDVSTRTRRRFCRRPTY